MGRHPTNWGGAASSPEPHNDSLPHDIIQTFGCHLLRKHPDTPLHADRRARRSDSFAADLCRRLEDIQLLQRIRCKDYGRGVAEEWPGSRTPPETRSEFLEKQRRCIMALEAPTPPGDDDDDGGGDGDDNFHWSSSSGLGGNFAAKQSCSDEDITTDDVEMTTTAPVVHQQLTPPDSFPRKVDTPLAAPHRILADSDSEHDHRPYTKMPQEDEAARPTVRVLGQRVGSTKRTRSLSDIDEENGSRKSRCWPTRTRTSYLASQSRFVKAN